MATLVGRLTIEDPRWDAQLDSREDYYAQLGLWSGMSVDPLRRHLQQSDDRSRQTGRVSLAIGVLGAMARRSHQAAVEVLRTYVRSGTWWDEALYELGKTGRPETWAGLDHALRSRFRDDELEDELWKAHGEAVSSWATGDGPVAGHLAQVRRQARSRQPGRNLTALSTDALLGLNPRDFHEARAVINILERRTEPADRDALGRALRSEDPWLASLAPSALARQGDQSILGRCEALLRLGRHRGRYIIRGRIRRALEALPAEATLPLARAWRSSRTHALRVAADRLLTLHATAEDLPWIRRQLRLPVSDRRVYRVCSVLEMLARLGGAGSFDEILPVYRSFPYSYGRRFAVQALRTTDPEFPTTVAFEALWDCEPEIRGLAAESITGALPCAKDRLTEIAGDHQEDQEVRKAVMARLGLTTAGG